MLHSFLYIIASSDKYFATIQAAIQNDEIHTLHEKLAHYEKRASILRQKEERYSSLLAERDSLKDSLHQQKMQNLILEQKNKELYERVCALEEEVRRGESLAQERELEREEIMKTLDQYKSKITKLNNTVMALAIQLNCTLYSSTQT